MSFIENLKKQLSNVSNSIKEGVKGVVDNLSSYKNQVLERAGVKPKISIEDVDELEFDRLARERGYVKKTDRGDQFERRATEDTADRVKYEDDVDEELPFTPLTKEQQDKLDILYYAEYTVDVLITLQNGETFYLSEKFMDKPPQVKTTKLHATPEDVIQEIKFMVEGVSVGKTGVRVVTSQTMYKINKRTGESTIIN
jgi:hypothetical protein